MNISTSFLFVPATKAMNFLEKVFEEDSSLRLCKAVIFDLEDSVPDSLKQQSALELVKLLYKRSSFLLQRMQIYIRLNAIDSGFLIHDVEILRPLIQQYPIGLMLAKCRDCSQIQEIHQRLLASMTNRIIPTIETLQGYIYREEIFSYAKMHSFPGIAFGAGDMSLELLIERNYELLPLQKIMADLLIESKIHQVSLIDSPSRILPKPEDGWERDLVRECEWSFKNGFSGKIAIHPGQLPFIEQFYSNTPNIEMAEKIMTFYSQNSNSNAHKHPITGDYIGLPVLKMAKKSFLQHPPQDNNHA